MCCWGNTFAVLNAPDLTLPYSMRPAWFRFSAMRAPAPPPPAPVPAPAPAPAPPLGQPAFPFRAPPPPTQTQEPPRDTSAPTAAPPVRQLRPPSSLPPTAPPSPQRPAAEPPVRPPPLAPSPPSPRSSPAKPLPRPAAPQPRSPSASPPRRAASPPGSPRRSPAAPPEAPPRYVVKTPTPPRTSASPPSPLPPPSSPVSKETLTSRNYQKPSSPPPKSTGREATPASSPKTKPLSRPPSPLTLPPPQIMTDSGRDHQQPRVEQKTVLDVHETSSGKPTKMQHNSHYNHGSLVPAAKREAPTKDKAALSKKSSDHEGHGMRIITIAGDNKGAVMEMNKPHKKNYSHTLQKEGKSDTENKNKNAMKNQYEEAPTTAYLNSNVQGINNSIVYNSNIRHKDPGIHLSLIRKARGDHRNKD